MINVSLTFQQDFAVLTFDIPGGICVPADLADLDAAIDSLVSHSDMSSGFIISGRGPIWVFAAIAHALHPAKWVATHDPRLGGAVVVSTHVPGVNIGDLIDFN